MRLASKGETSPMGDVQPNIREVYSVFAEDTQYHMLNFVKVNGLDIVFAKELGISVDSFNKGLEWGKGSKLYIQQLSVSYGWNHNGDISISKAWIQSIQNLNGVEQMRIRVFNLITISHEYVHNFDNKFTLKESHKMIRNIFYDKFGFDENNPFEVGDAYENGILLWPVSKNE